MTGSVSSIGFPSWRVGGHPFRQTPDAAFLSNRARLGENLGTLLERRSRRDKTAGSTISETTMPKFPALLLFAALASASALSSDADTVLAQGAQPSLPGAPQPSCPAPPPTPSFPGGPRLPGGPPGGSGNYAVSAAANEHAAFLWVVDNVQHAVVLVRKGRRRAGISPARRSRCLDSGAVEARHRRLAAT